MPRGLFNQEPDTRICQGTMAVAGGTRERGARACFLCPAPLSEHGRAVRNTGGAIIQALRAISSRLAGTWDWRGN